MKSSATTESASISALIQRHQTAIGKADEQLAEELGYAGLAPLRQIKAGRMHLPVAKAPLLAQALDLDELSVVRQLLSEQAPDTLKVIERLFDPLRLSSTEVRLIEHCRKLGAGDGAQPLVFSGRTVIALVAA
jgi:hypothetical protein